MGDFIESLNAMLRDEFLDEESSYLRGNILQCQMVSVQNRRK